MEPGYPAFGTPLGPMATFLPVVHRAFVPSSQLHLPRGAEEVWSTEAWGSHLVAYGKQLDYACLSRLAVAQGGLGRFSSAVAALVGGDPLRVLDIGGSIGENLVQVFASIPPNLHPRIEWTVCDNARSIGIGQGNFAGMPYQPCFTTFEALVQSGKRFDLGLLCGTLQYLENPVQAIQGMLDLLRGDKAGIYIHRTPFCVSSGEHGVIRQLVHPAFGPFKDRYIGETQLNLLSLQRFVADLAAAGCEVRYLDFFQPYVEQMKHLPEPFREVHYIDLFIARAVQPMRQDHP